MWQRGSKEHKAVIIIESSFVTNKGHIYTSAGFMYRVLMGMYSGMHISKQNQNRLVSIYKKMATYVGLMFASIINATIALVRT
jgi:hypothetical protein